MRNYNPLLLIDFYKATHSSQYPRGMTRIYSTGTPRMSRLKDVDRVSYFGGQAFCKEYLIDMFNDNFFSRPKDEVMKEYTRIMNHTLGYGACDTDKIGALHDLGYLPIEVLTIPEGRSTAIGVPQTVFVNTHPDFAWLTNTLESMYSAYIWHIQVSVEVGKRYRKICKHYRDLTAENTIPVNSLLGDFSFRGQHCPESGITSSAAWLLSFRNTATVPAIMWLEDNYNADCTVDVVGLGAISTEHSVMCSNAAVDGDEITHIKRLLTEIYPDHNFSMVSDSYDYWNVVDNIVPSCKKEILEHNGTFLVRGDSGDPVEVVTETVFHLWKHFGGTINSKGYKVLDPHVKAIYGDSITPQRCEAIYKILKENGFACNNVVLGVGSFSFMCLETIDENDNKNYAPYTRDTFGYAIKATYGERNGEPIMIFKQPKGASWKKSQKGCVYVYPSGNGYRDGLTYEEAHCGELGSENLLQPIFRDGKMIKESSLEDIRARMWAEEGVSFYD